MMFSNKSLICVKTNAFLAAALFASSTSIVYADDGDREIEQGQMGLQDLPAEVLAHISSFLGHEDLICNFEPTSRQFQEIVKIPENQKRIKKFKFEKTNFNLANTLKLNGSARSVAFPVSGATVITATGSDDTIWDLKSGSKVGTREMSPATGLLSPDGRYSAEYWGGEGCALWDHENKFPIYCNDATGDEIVTFSADGNLFAAVSESDSSRMLIWNLKTSSLVHDLDESESEVNTLALTSNGKYLASGSRDGIIFIREVKSGKKLKMLKGHELEVNTLAFSSDGKYLASGSGDKTVIIWDARSGKKLKTLKGHDLEVNSVAFSPDGEYLASGANDQTAIIWEVKSGEKLKTLTGHEAEVSKVAFSPDGEYLVSGAEDQTVKVWKRGS